jgi:pyrimidine operon attenuation protein/uracil phosphoribosyltransferase
MTNSKLKEAGPTGGSAVMDAAAIARALSRIAHEIVEANADLGAIILAGIPARGNEIARRIAASIQSIQGRAVETGVIDVAMHRDDVGIRPDLPVVRASDLPHPLEGRTVIIVDDVLYTGRTVRAALDAIGSFGRPARIPAEGRWTPRTHKLPVLREGRWTPPQEWPVLPSIRWDGRGRGRGSRPLSGSR